MLMGHTIPKTVRAIYLIKMPNIITHSVSYGNTLMDVCNGILWVNDILELSFFSLVMKIYGIYDYGIVLILFYLWPLSLK